MMRAFAVAALCLIVVVAGYLVFRPRAAPKRVAKPDPSQLVVDVELPVVDVVGSTSDSFRASEVTLPIEALWRVRGAFRTEHRDGGSLVIAEVKIPSRTGMSMTTNGVAGVMMKKFSNCEFEILLKQPQSLTRAGIIELRLGDQEHLAIVPFQIDP